MTVNEQIDAYIGSQPGPKRGELQKLHGLFLSILPKGRLWFLDGKNEDGKVVSNPNIGYGLQVTTLAGGKTREFYQIGLSANTTGISVYLLGLKDQNYLADTFGKSLAKASVTGYCIKFRSIADIRFDVLEAAVRDATKQTGGDL